jgi:pyruvate dehydrogenase kinase 2/3/4
MLLGQHIALVNSMLKPKSVAKDYVGIICTKTKVHDIVQHAINDARFICQEYYGLLEAPQVLLLGADDLQFMYVPSHLHHMIFELMKNSLRAVVERFGLHEDYPPIKVIVAAGDEDITISMLCR